LMAQLEEFTLKQHYEDLREFGIDQQIHPNQTEHRIHNVYSTSKESSKPSNDLLKDLLDCIPHVIPFGEETKIHGDFENSFKSIQNISAGESSVGHKTDAVHYVEGFLESYTDQLKKFEPSLKFDMSSPFLRKLYKARQLQHLARNQPLAELRMFDRNNVSQQTTIPDTSTIYSHKNTDSENQTRPEQDLVSFEQILQDRPQQQQQKEKGKYWKSMVGEDDDDEIWPRRKSNSSQGSGSSEASVTPLSNLILEEAQEQQHEQQQQGLTQHGRPPATPMSPPHGPQSFQPMCFVSGRQFQPVQARVVPLRAAMSDTAVTTIQHNLMPQYTVKAVLSEQQTSPQKFKPQQQLQEGYPSLGSIGAYGDAPNQQQYQQQQQLQPWRSPRRKILGGSKGSQQQPQQPHQLLQQQQPHQFEKDKGITMLQYAQQRNYQQTQETIVSMPSSPRRSSLQPQTNSQWQSQYASGVAVNQQETAQPLKAANVITWSAKPVGTSTPQPIPALMLTVPTRPANGVPTTQASIWTAPRPANGVPTTQASIWTAPRQQPQKHTQKPKQVITASTHLFRGFGQVPTSAAAQAPQSVPAAVRVGGAASGGVILPSQLMEVKSQPIQLVPTHPANAVNASGVGGPAPAAPTFVVLSTQPPQPKTMMQQPAMMQQQTGMVQQQMMNPSSPSRGRTNGSKGVIGSGLGGGSNGDGISIAGRAGIYGKSGANAGGRGSGEGRAVGSTNDSATTCGLNKPSDNWGTAATFGEPFQVSLPGGKLIADNNRGWMENIVSILDMKNKEEKEAHHATSIWGKF